MRTNISIAVLVFSILTIAGCRSTQQSSNSKQLTLAINSGVEGDALKQAALDYEKQTGVQINIAEFPYANLFEKELIDLNAHTGAYDLIMLDDPWFPRFASQMPAQDVFKDVAPKVADMGKVVYRWTAGVHANSRTVGWGEHVCGPCQRVGQFKHDSVGEDYHCPASKIEQIKVMIACE